MRKICRMCKYWNADTYKCKIANTTTEQTYTCFGFESIPCCGNCQYYSEGYCRHHRFSVDNDEKICRDNSWSENPAFSTSYNENRIYNYDRRPEKKSGGCYIATCVYGSYDCPQVRTLRRYRDNTLSKTVFGRMFIKIYYAVSPTLVKWFGKTKWFKKMWKCKLDRMVYRLKLSGVEDTPYSDK